MTNSTDGGYDSEGNYYDPSQVPGNTAIAIELVHFTREITDVMAKCKDYFGSNHDDLALKIAWPKINIHVSRLLRRARDIEQFELVLQELENKYPEFDDGILRAHVGTIISAAESIEDIVSIQELNIYPQPPEDMNERVVLKQRIEDFCEVYADTYNRVAIACAVQTTNEKQWLDPETVIRDVPTGQYL